MSTRRRGHVKQRGATFTAYWRVRDHDGRSVQRSKGGFSTTRAAEQHLTKVLRELDTGSYVEPDRKVRAQTLAMFLRETWLPAVKVTLRSSTWESYRSNIELHVIPRLGGLRLVEITPDRLNRLYAELLESGYRKGKTARGLSPRTVRYCHTVLRRALQDAVLWDRIVRNPADRATPPESKRSERPIWSSAELRRFVNHVRDDRLFAAWMLLVTTGMRRGEVLGLRWSDFDGGAVSIQQTLVAIGYRVEISEPKTARSRRRVGIPKGTAVALRSWRAAQAQERLAWGPAWTDTGLIFSREDGTPVHPQSLSQSFERHARAAGLPVIPLHSLRHSYATVAFAEGVQTKALSERLGHSTISTTADIYGHVLPEVDDAVAARIADAIFGAS